MSAAPTEDRSDGASTRREVRSVTKIGILVLLLAGCTALRWAADPFLPIPIPFTFYLLGIVATTVLCGARWGFAATGMSLLLALYFWIPPKMALRMGKMNDGADLLVWTVVSLFIVWILSALQRAVIAQTRLAAQLSEKSAILAESEAKLRLYSGDLEQLVSERSRKLAQTVEDLESFAYVVSHNLRSPLRAMQGFAHLASEEAGGRLSERGRQYLQRIDSAAQRMDELIGDLLSYNSDHEARGRLEPVDVESVVDDVLQKHPEWKDRGASIEVRRPLDAVRGNRSSLVIVLSHFLGNAVKFAAADRPAHAIVRTERHGEKVRVVVEDNGIGVPGEFMAHLFKPFYRGHANEGYEGRGIGLAIAKKATLRMGGEIGVDGARPVGSAFWVELPAARIP